MICWLARQRQSLISTSSACPWLGGCPTTERPWFWEETLWRGPGLESHDMEGPTRGATCRCASVSEGFLHRNCVLSVPSQSALAVVLSKHIDISFIFEGLSSPFLNFFYVISFIAFHACSIIAAIVGKVKSQEGQSQSLPLVNWPFGSWSNMILYVLYFPSLLGSHGKVFHWQTGLRVVRYGVLWLTAALCNHITDSAKEPHHNLSLKSH